MADFFPSDFGLDFPIFGPAPCLIHTTSFACYFTLVCLGWPQDRHPLGPAYDARQRSGDAPAWILIETLPPKVSKHCSISTRRGADFPNIPTLISRTSWPESRDHFRFRIFISCNGVHIYFFYCLDVIIVELVKSVNLNQYYHNFLLLRYVIVVMYFYIAISNL